VGADSGKFQVEKMRFPDKNDKSVIEYNPWIKITSIPLEAYDYVVNGRSAIEWVMERYQVKLDSASGIKNDPNDWAEEHDQPSYILDLLLSVMTISLETVKIVKALPKLVFNADSEFTASQSAPKWDIYTQQPIMLHHPALHGMHDDTVFVAGVCKTKQGAIWWSAGYFIAEHISSQPGSGFAENPLLARPKYVKAENCWVVEEENGRVYKFCLPNRDMLVEYEKFKQYIPTIEKLLEYTKKWDVD
jgi:hypothetical protein